MRARAIFQITSTLATAIRASALSQTKLAFSVNLNQSQVSEFLNGKTFGPAVKRKLEDLAVMVGVEPSAAVRVAESAGGRQ